MTLKLYLLMAVLGGVISVVGTNLMRFGLTAVQHHVFTNSETNFSLNSQWDILAFVSGAVSVALVTPFLVSKIQSTDDKRSSWTKWGISFGALAGLANVVVLASIHLSLWVASGIQAGAGILSLISFYLTYLSLSLIIFGLPALIIGALAGIAGEGLLRKFLFQNDQSTIV
jgi:hypothetical protein